MSTFPFLYIVANVDDGDNDGFDSDDPTDFDRPMSPYTSLHAPSSGTANSGYSGKVNERVNRILKES